MKLLLDYDDFCSQNPENCLETIYEMIKEVPHIKFNMFTVPAMRGEPNNDEWLNKVQKLIDSDNVRLCVHGLFHDILEFENIGETVCQMYFDLIDTYKKKINYLPVFKGPHWGINGITIEKLIDQGYTHVYNHENHKYLENLYSDKIKFVYYNQNLKDELIPMDIMIAHGHTHNVCENGIKETKDKVLTFINRYKPEFIWADEI